MVCEETNSNSAADECMLRPERLKSRGWRRQRGARWREGAIVRIANASEGGGVIILSLFHWKKRYRKEKVIINLLPLMFRKYPNK